jgi:hypothetical protein
VPTQLLGDDGSNSGVVPGELNRQNWSRPSVPGFRFVAAAAVSARLPLCLLAGREEKSAPAAQPHMPELS